MQGWSIPSVLWLNVENKMTLGLIIMFFLTPQDSREFTLSFLLNVEDYNVYDMQLICVSVLLHNQKLFCICLQIWNHEQPLLVDAVTTLFCCQKTHHSSLKEVYMYSGSFSLSRFGNLFVLVIPSANITVVSEWLVTWIVQFTDNCVQNWEPMSKKWQNSTHLWRVMYQLNSYQDQREC